MKRVTFQLILFFFLPLACGAPEKTTDPDHSPRKKQVMQYMDSGWNSIDGSSLGELLAEGYERNLNGIQVVKGTVELEAYIQNYRRAFPDLKVTLDQWVESDEQVVAVWTFEGTNTGVFGEFVPTGKKARVHGVSLFTVNEQNKIISEDIYYNELYLLQQLGYDLIPPILE